MDGFSGCKQITMHRADKEKTAFTTLLGTFVYNKSPFGLMNVGATFLQRDMDIAFVEERDKFIVIYLDNITIFSRLDEDHLYLLRQMFLKCRKLGLSLNPKISFFALQEGKLLGHLVSKDGVNIDLESVEAISKINLP